MTDDAFHLTALDARRYDFGNALRGYDRARVDQFRDQVAEELERLSRANQELEAKARNFHEQLRAFRERDKALNDALISAQQLRGEIREQAQREAQLIIREAQGEAERSLEALRGDIRRAEDELQQLWRNRRSYLAQLRQLMERQIADLDNADSAPPPSGVAARASDGVQSNREGSRDMREAVREPVRDAVPEIAAPILHPPVRERVREVVQRDVAPEPQPPLPGIAEFEPVRDIPRELEREFASEMTQSFREPAKEPLREPVREPIPEAPRPGVRQPWATQTREPILEGTRETMSMPTPEVAPDRPRDNPPPTAPAPAVPPRPSLPTPSWLDVVEGE